jgi:hypothetical protein
MLRLPVQIALFAAGLCLSGTALASVTIRGNIQYYDPEKSTYVPLKEALVEVEFDCWDACDKKVHTDAAGNYQVTQRNPNWPYSSWEVNLDVHAEWTDRFQIYDSFWSWWPYYVVSPTIRCSKDSTCTLNLRIGGPSSTVSHYEYGSVEDNLAALFAHQEMRDHYRFMTSRAAVPSDFEEKEVFYPDSSSQYVAVIDYIYLKPITDRGPTKFAYVVRHEYSHSMQADVYWMLPIGWESVEYWMTGQPHNFYVQTGAEYAFIEGWAEFLSVVTNPRNTGPYWAVLRSFEDFNMEDSRAPWRVSLIGKGLTPWKCEGDVAGVLWDIYDPVGKERTLIQYPDIPGDETWDDQLTDPNLNRIWTIMKENEPDAILDDGDLWLDSFWYYWDKRYGDAHALKAIYFNRGIHLEKYPQHPPTIAIHQVRQDPSGSGRLVQVTVEVGEADPEDRPHLEVDLWVTTPGGQARKVVSQAVTGTWSGSTKTVTLSHYTPTPYPAGTKFLAAVNDDMEYAKATWTLLQLSPPLVVVSPLGTAARALATATSAIPMRRMAPLSAGTRASARAAAVRTAGARPRASWVTAPVTEAIKGYRKAYRDYHRAIDSACWLQARLAYRLGQHAGALASASLAHVRAACDRDPRRARQPVPPPVAKLRGLMASLARGELPAPLTLDARAKASFAEELREAGARHREFSRRLEEAHAAMVRFAQSAHALVQSPVLTALKPRARAQVQSMLVGVGRVVPQLGAHLGVSRQDLQKTEAAIRTLHNALR